MKATLMLLLSLPMWAAEPEGTEWYDAEGNLVLVEGPGAKPAEVPFVAEWRKREIERRERTASHWTGDLWPVWNNGYRVRHFTYPAYRIRYRYLGGGFRHRGYARFCRPVRGGGLRVTIRR